MSDPRALAAAAGATLFQRAERHLKVLLAEHDVTDFNELTREQANEIYIRSITGAAAEFPGADLGMVAHGARSLTNPAFISVLERVSIAMNFRSDPLAPAAGVDAAVLLAGFGLPVVPFDLENARILEAPSKDIDTVTARFGKWKRAYVGYNSCAAPFYLLYTDCLRTLINRVATHPKLAEVKKLFERPGSALPQDPGQSFVSGMAIFARLPGDMISTAALLDWDPSAGSIVFNAGWEVDGQSHGAPNDGYFPVPVQLLRAVVNNPAVAYGLARPVKEAPTLH
jgi:hypothetical protein